MYKYDLITGRVSSGLEKNFVARLNQMVQLGWEPVTDSLTGFGEYGLSILIRKEIV